MDEFQRPRWYSVDGRTLPSLLRGENYGDVADLLERADGDDEKTIAALVYGVATTTGEPKAIMEQMLAGYQVAFELPAPDEGQVLAASISDSPLADSLGRIADFTGHSTKSLLALMFGRIDGSEDVDDQIQRGAARLIAFVAVAEAAMPEGDSAQLVKLINDAFAAGLDEQEIALATARMNQLDVARLIRRSQ